MIPWDILFVILFYLNNLSLSCSKFYSIMNLGRFYFVSQSISSERHFNIRINEPKWHNLEKKLKLKLVIFIFHVFGGFHGDFLASSIFAYQMSHCSNVHMSKEFKVSKLKSKHNFFLNIKEKEKKRTLKFV